MLWPMLCSALLLHVHTMCVATARGGPVSVTLETKYNVSCEQSFGSMFWLPASALGPLGMPTVFCGSNCGTVAFAGKTFSVTQINPKDGSAACDQCGGCATAFVGVEASPKIPSTLRPGQNVTMTYVNDRPSPPPPPSPSPPPPPSPPAPGPAPPSVRHVPLLSKQPAFCMKQFTTNYVWLAEAHLPCLGVPPTGCGGASCGTLSINGHMLNVTGINQDDHDVCGTCEGCPTAFVAFDTSIPAAAQAFEGKNATLFYQPPLHLSDASTRSKQHRLPECPALPTAWRTLVGQQLSPECSPYESQGSLGVTATASDCLAKAQASGSVNYALWHGATNKSCNVCAIRWRGPAENWQFSNASGMTSFAWYVSLPPPKPSALCPVCPPSTRGHPESDRAVTRAEDSPTVPKLENDRIQAFFDSRGLRNLSSRVVNVTVGKDDFALGLDHNPCICSSSLAEPTIKQVSDSLVSFEFISPLQQLLINVTYELRTQWSFITKTITLTDTSNTNRTREVNSVSAMDGVALRNDGVPTGSSTDTRISSNVQFFRWNDTRAPATRTVGAFLTAQNQFVKSPGLGWVLDQNWTTLDVHGVSAPRVLDSALIGLYDSYSSQVDFSESQAVTDAVSAFLVQPSEDNETVKINIAWCENDYQLDIALPEDREAYKRIIDRAAEMGITHILFAPRNSDVSSAANNTDPWGWEQILWFGYGQKLRMGEWVPGDPLASSTQEMLDYFEAKGVKPVAYVYPILAFLAGTLPGGGDPSWIVQGTYMSETKADRLKYSDTAALGGILRSNLANEEFIQWLPNTMLAFADQTGAGGFSFDLTCVMSLCTVAWQCLTIVATITMRYDNAILIGLSRYWEETLPVASEYAQWAGWRNILSQLHTKRGGKGCAGSRCVVDNRQANHGWGAWMWALGGTYAEPLMSDEQPASWSFYEPDLHTDRLAGNKQRAVARQYRAEYCPNDALPGFAFHQTDRDPTMLQNKACSQGRCSNHSRVRDFDLLGFRYSLLSSIGSGGLNNVLNMLPARDPQEYRLFPQDDLSFVAKWLNWTNDNVGLLKLTRPIPSMATPGLGQADGTIMLREDNTGVMFLFNPTSREINVSLPLSGDGSAALGFSCLDSTVPTVVRQLDSSERTSPKPIDLRVVRCNDSLNLILPPTSARVIGFEQWTGSTKALLLGSVASDVTVDASTVTISGAEGESGTASDLVVVLPKGSPRISEVVINGERISTLSMLLPDCVYGQPAVAFTSVWEGKRFSRTQEITSTGSSSGLSWTGRFAVPYAVMEQLRARNASYPVLYNTDPEDSDDANVPWLAPGRLLLFIKYSTPIDDSVNITGTIDGRSMLVRKAYNTIVRNPGRFIGHWADVTGLVQVDKEQVLALQLPAGQKPDGVFFDNVETIFTKKVANKKKLLVGSA